MAIIISLDCQFPLTNTHTSFLFLFFPRFEYPLTSGQLKHHLRAFTCLVLEWAQTLRWPVEQAEHDPGVSLVELLINFILVTGVAFPCQVSRKAARVVFRHETQAAEVALIPCAFEEAMRTLDSIDFQRKRLFGLLLTPHELKCQGQFLRNYGCNKMRRGWTRRPEMLYPKETIETVTRAVHFGSFQSMFSHPGPCCNFGPAHWTRFQMM